MHHGWIPQAAVLVLLLSTAGVTAERLQGETISAQSTGQAPLPVQSDPGEGALEEARRLFYASVEDKKQVGPAIAAFEEIVRLYPEWTGRARTYIGALVALRGKHSILPHDKWRWANRGLDIMDEGVALDPEDVESLFIHSSTCYFLPFFFNRGDDAQAKFRELIRLLPEKYHEFPRSMIANVVQFIQERAQLTEEEKAALQRLKELSS
jgi:hypothetical protein